MVIPPLLLNAPIKAKTDKSSNLEVSVTNGGVSRQRRSNPVLRTAALVAICSLLYYFHQFSFSADSSIHISQAPKVLPLKSIDPRLHVFQKCSVETLKHDTNYDFLATASPPTVEEFISRRDRLALALIEDGVDAFIVEPGYTFSYYANVTQPDCKFRDRRFSAP
jgi:hypothetical protein